MRDIPHWPGPGSAAVATLQRTTAAITLVEGVAAAAAAYFIGRERAT